MSISLVCADGRSVILLDRTLVVVGRHPLCDSRLFSSRVSRWHCCLTSVAGEVYVRDLGSANGTWINGLRVTSGRLTSGDVLSLAHLRFRIQEGEADQARKADSSSGLEDHIVSLADTQGTALCDELGDK
jgi:pSer/pThr/pTyr-binding forkhead associated (FHA) protein